MPGRAKNIGGKWSARDRCWLFDARDEQRVRELAISVYGTDGNGNVELVTVRVTLWGSQRYDGGSAWMFGRELARRAFRDSQVVLGEGVIIIEGDFPRSGGSRKYPGLFSRGDQKVVLEVRDVPRILVVEDEDVVVVEMTQGADPFSGFGDVELITELERRGYSIGKEA